MQPPTTYPVCAPPLASSWIHPCGTRYIEVVTPKGLLPFVFTLPAFVVNLLKITCK